MSRLFRNEVGILLAPDKVLLVRVRHRMKSKCVAERGITVDAAGPGDFGPALRALDAELAGAEWGDARVRVVISDQWVRYELLPWSVELGKEAERITHARFLLAATYGDIVDQWTVTLSDAAPGEPRLVSAIPTSLLDELRTITAEHGLKMTSLQPQLVAAYNVWRHRLPREAAWFVTIDDCSLVALHLRDGHCDRVRAVRISDDWSVELKRIQTMGRLAQSRPAEGPVFVEAPRGMRTIADGQRASVEWLEHDEPPRDTLACLTALRESYA